jgi:orotidine-5'-phosphate decarboxylase
LERVSDPFGARLDRAMRDRGPLCVGIDPHPALLGAWGLPDTPGGLEQFAKTCVDALGGVVPVLKPQSAFFERHGSRGVAVLEQTIAAARSTGCLVLLDAKRGDIGSTMQAYADAYLDPTSPLAVDALTVNPFLGFGSLAPVLDAAAASGAGVFVLALTSNPEGGSVQSARSPGGTVAGDVLAAIRRVNAGAHPVGSVGAVVAANLSEVTDDLDINGPLLAPGLGAQGGTAADLRRIFGSVAGRVLPSTSRGVLGAGPEVRRMRDAARAAADAVAAALGRRG